MFDTSSSVRAATALVALLAGLSAMPSAAQWAWKDGNGRTVYSDRPPPADVKPTAIMKQPNTQTLANPAPASGPLDDAKAEVKSDTKTPTPSAGPKTTAEREMEFRKRQQERAESDKKAADEQARSAVKSAECDRARGYMKSLEDGVRIQRTDAAGNREFLDDSQRAAEMERARKVIQASCG